VKAEVAPGLNTRAGHTAVEALAGVDGHPPGKVSRRADAQGIDRAGSSPRRFLIAFRVPRERANSRTRPANARGREEARRLLADANVEQLRRLGRALGNEALSGRIAHNDAVRDALLAVVHERLQAVDAAQQAELKSLRERSRWWRDLRRGARDVGLPEPTRWGEVARLYRQATVAVCGGDLGRGVDLLRQALNAERTARRNVPTQVALPAHDAVPRQEPAAAVGVNDGEGCTPTNAPATLALADRIENVSTTQRDAARLQNTGGDRVWWGEAQEKPEAEEEEARTAPSPGSRRLREPAAVADLARRPDGVAPGPAPLVREVRAEVARPAPTLAPRLPETSLPAEETGPGQRPRRTPKR
jgi:hypothetical protein